MKAHHICIQTDTYDRSLKFYTEILQFDLIKESPGFHGRAFNSWLNLEGFMIELQTNKTGEALGECGKDRKGIVHFCLFAESIDKEYKRIKGSGFQDFLPKGGVDIYEVEGGKLFKITAPEGTIIEVRDMNTK